MITRAEFDAIPKDLVYDYGVISVHLRNGVAIPIRQFVRWDDGCFVAEIHAHRKFKPREFVMIPFESVQAIYIQNEPTLNNRTTLSGTPPGPGGGPRVPLGSRRQA